MSALHHADTLRAARLILRAESPDRTARALGSRLDKVVYSGMVAEAAAWGIVRWSSMSSVYTLLGAVDADLCSLGMEL